MTRPSTSSTRMAAVQAEPAWGDLAGSVRKTVALIEAAAAKGIKVLVFPELWVSGYPFWIWFMPPVQWGPSWSKYLANGLRTDSDEMNTIRRACAANDIWILLGFSEKQGSSLWMSTCWINNVGEVVAHRRKIMPTGAERVIFGNASGDTINNVIDSPFGRLGSLQCWEHAQPLLKYHTASLHEQVHAASWPCLFPHSGPEHLGMAKEGTLALNQAYSIENGAFNFVATCVMTEAGARALGFTDEMLAASFLSLPGGGASRVFGPDGRLLAGEELEPGEDGFAVWDVDLGDIASSKQLMDGVGHYSRPDIFRLHASNTGHSSVNYGPLPAAAPPSPLGQYSADPFADVAQPSSCGSSFDHVDAIKADAA